MTDLNNLIAIIRRKCEQQKKLAEVACFEAIANEARIPMNSLPYYLDKLQREGYIKYSWDDRFLYLTIKGKRHGAYTPFKESPAG